DWMTWNTLGVAAYRVRDWETAAEVLQKSIHISGGGGMECLFLAMTRWQQGRRQEARQWFDQAIAWIGRANSPDPELRRFRAEAATLLGPDRPALCPDEREAPKAKASGPAHPNNRTDRNK